MAKRSRSGSPSRTDDNLDISPASTTSSVELDGRAAKYASLEPDSRTGTAMRCHLPPHKPMSFIAYDEYERHYERAHTNRCRGCGKNFPSAHLLELHITEHHDPIVGARRDQGEKTYGCFVEGCEKMCSDWTKRRSHLVDKHGYPRNYDFFIVKTGVDGRRSMLRPGVDAQGHRRSSRERRGSSSTEDTEATQSTAATSEGMGTEQSRVKQDAAGSAIQAPAKPGVSNKEVNALASSMSALNMVPRSITFGKRKGKSGFAKS